MRFRSRGFTSAKVRQDGKLFSFPQKKTASSALVCNSTSEGNRDGQETGVNANSAWQLKADLQEMLHWIYQGCAT